MFKTAFNFLSANAGAGGVLASEEGAREDPIVGSTVDVGDVRVRVERRIGEGGFAFVYAVQGPGTGGSRRAWALKRLLAADGEKRASIVREISYLKSLRAGPHILQYETAAHLPAGQGLSASRCEEYLLLTELCAASLFDYLRDRSRPYPPVTVARIFFQTLEAVAFLHRASPPIIHRDLKVENLLIDARGGLKLCDLGSATSTTFEPDASWNMSQRTRMEEAIQRFTTPMYRAPEMVDAWSNAPVNAAADVWALGCLLFQLSCHQHPFPDGAKLQIINGNFSLPVPADTAHGMFHDLIGQMLAVDPTCRPTVLQAQQHLGEVAVRHEWDLEAAIDFELSLPTEPVAVEPLPEPSPDPSPTAGGPAQLFTSLKGGAGSMLGKLKDTSKSMVSSWLAPKDLDFHLLTSRVAAMSYPAEGLDYTSRNQLEDIRQIMEANHLGHYAIVNLCERHYPALRFASGTLIDAGWSSQTVPSLEQLLETSVKVIEYLTSHKSNVVALHCLNGQSNTAMLFAALMLIGQVCQRGSQALALFEAQRCQPVLTLGQRAVLQRLETLLRQGPFLHIPRQVATITGIILEPVPLFTKALDGCRPFLEIYQGSQLVSSTFQDYASLKLFTPYDGDVKLKTHVKVMGDVTIIVYHGRQSMGTFFASKVDKILVGKVFLTTAQLPASKSFIKFKTHELDSLGDLERIPGDFSIAVNYQVKEIAKDVAYPYKMPTKRMLDLFFTTKGEYHEAMTLAKKGQTPSAPVSEVEDTRASTPPVRPPRHTQSKADQPTPSSLIDVGEDSVPTPAAHQGLFEAPLAAPSVGGETLLSLDDPPSQSQDPPPNLDLFGQSETVLPQSQNSSPDDILLDFGHPVPGAQQTSSANVNFNLFDDLPSTGGNHLNGNSPGGDLLSPLSASKPPPADILSPNQPPSKSASEQMVDDMLSQMNLGPGTNHPPTSNPPGPGSRPNYSSAFFNNNESGPGQKPPSQATFDDLLGGFTPSGSGQNRSIGDMQKEEKKKVMTPEEAMIFEWTHGKSRNLRALLCSLDTVIWSGSRWTKCGMHQLVTFNDVKKMYRKACLAVHPDKQMNTPNEELAKIIFTELNDGWSKFQEDEAP